jgi:hypothetical protein
MDTNDASSGSRRSNSFRKLRGFAFPIALFLFQLLFIVLFGVFGDYDTNGTPVPPGNTTVNSEENIRQLYPS